MRQISGKKINLKEILPEGTPGQSRDKLGENAKQRMSDGGKRKGKENLPYPIKELGQSRDKLGEKAKVSGRITGYDPAAQSCSTVLQHTPGALQSEATTCHALRGGVPVGLLINDEDLQNDEGYYRLCFVHSGFGLSTVDVGSYEKDGFTRFVTAKVLDHCLSVVECDRITELYVAWRDQRELLPVECVYSDGSAHSFFSLVPKRGNSEYIKNVRRQLDVFISKKPIVFFDPSWGKKSTPMLYITCTCDHAIVGEDPGVVWLRFGKMWNNFVSKLRQQYGKLAYIRTWQSQGNYYPHAHCLILFVDKIKDPFNVVEWVDSDGSISYRLPANSNVRKFIKSAWSYGFCDIKCIQDTGSAFKDLLKYVTRDLEGGESDKTNGMVWFFQKRSFAVSDEFEKFFNASVKEPEVPDLEHLSCGNSNKTLVRINVFPVMGARFVPETWQKTLICEDPPPDLAVFFDHLKFVCDETECKPSKEFADRGVRVFVWRKRKEGKY